MACRSGFARVVVGMLAMATGVAVAPAPSATASRVAAPASPEATAATSSAVQLGRLAGSNRYETAVKISERAFPVSAENVYLARADVLSDAIAAGTLTDGPVLLVPRCGEAPAVVRQEIARLNPKTVTAIGGGSSVCVHMMDQLVGNRDRGQRLAGYDRYATAQKIAWRREVLLWPDGASKRAYVASGANDSPDAVIGGVLTDGPILTVPKQSTSGVSAADWFGQRHATTAVALGGKSAVSDSILADFTAEGATSVSRIGGGDRYATSVAISQRQFPGKARVVYLARGDVFADAVASGALTDGPVFLTKSCSLPPVVKQAIANARPTSIIALGGTSSVCGAVLRDAQSAVPPGGATPGLSGLAVGWDSSCAISYGLPLCWGANDKGQLGIGSTSKANRAAPQPSQVRGLYNATKVAVGRGHACAIDGAQAYCWGSNSDGQVGDGRRVVAQPWRSKVLGLTGVTDIAPAQSFTCAVASSVPYCWGVNGNGQLGNGTNTGSAKPTRVSGLSSASTISAGGQHACAVSGGKAYCWGNNSSGQLGNGARVGSTVPKQVPNLSSVTGVAAASDHTCALSKGAVYCWGSNEYGQLGSGTLTDSTVPLKVPGLANVTSLTTSDRTVCALSSGTPYCWGDNHFGQVGNGTKTETWNGNEANPLTPAKVSKLSAASSIAAGPSTTCAVSGSKAYCWGSNRHSLVGVIPTQTLSTTPVWAPWLY